MEDVVGDVKNDPDKPQNSIESINLADFAIKLIKGLRIF